MLLPPSIPRRAPFPSDLQSLRQGLPQLIALLEAKPDWYGSVYIERKQSKTFTANLRQTQVSDQFDAGAVLRIYNGYTLFEQASDDLSIDSLKLLARQFADRVAKTPAPAGALKRPYAAPTWSDRMSVALDPEIKSQIPAGVAADTQVHFGIRFEEDPRAQDTQQILGRVKGIVERCKALAPECGVKLEELSYVLARQMFAVEESIFVDRGANLSQTLYRLALTTVTMSGSDRTFARVGGLGGLESLRFGDDDIRELLRDLAALKNAGRLSPGKYRVLMGPVLTGVLAHEAFGHSQEADTCARGRSKAWELHKSGESVGNTHATILNNPAIFQNGADSYAAWGSYFFDEEGWLAHEQVLLDQGQLKAPMTNLTSALRLNVPRTANGKRESWANGVYTRQTNTYFSAGDSTLDQLIEKMRDGFIATDPAGGMEDPKGMGIQVGISYLREVKGGKLTGKLLKGPAGGDVQLTGYVPDVLQAILGKSKIEAQKSGPDTARHPANDVGGCGKYHKELVNAGCGGTYLLLDQVTLG